MVHGKQGLQLEAVKFAMYLGIPILASVSFSYPSVQKYWADYFQFLKYPANPNIGMKEQYEELRQQRELQREQRQEYMNQMKRLQESADSAAAHRAKEEEEAAAKKTKRGWLW